MTATGAATLIAYVLGWAGAQVPIALAPAVLVAVGVLVGYTSPVLGLIFLRFADARFEAARERIEAKGTKRRTIGPSDHQAEGLISSTSAACWSETAPSTTPRTPTVGPIAKGTPTVPSASAHWLGPVDRSAWQSRRSPVPRNGVTPALPGSSRRYSSTFRISSPEPRLT